MATMRCPDCGREYRLTATRCRSCGADLVETLAGDDPSGAVAEDRVGVDAIGDDVIGDDAIDEPTDEGSVEDDEDDEDDEPARREESEHVAYELNEWSAQARVLLEQLLTGADITRVWEGTDLVVRANDEERVDELVEQVRATEKPPLDPDAEKIVYEVSDWTSDQLGTLTDALLDAEINYEFDIDGDLVVLASDEESVEALLDQIEFGPDPSATDGGAAGDDGRESDDDEDLDDRAAGAGGDADDGLETAEILSDLFVACDRLQKHASDHQGVLGAVAAANRLEGRPVPFGFEPRVWDEIQADAVALRADIEGDEATDIDLRLRAKAVRERLREYV
jgi:hypothetical protein